MAWAARTWRWTLHFESGEVSRGELVPEASIRIGHGH